MVFKIDAKKCLNYKQKKRLMLLKKYTKITKLSEFLVSYVILNYNAIAINNISNSNVVSLTFCIQELIGLVPYKMEPSHPYSAYPVNGALSEILY